MLFTYYLFTQALTQEQMIEDSDMIRDEAGDTP